MKRKYKFLILLFLIVSVPLYAQQTDSTGTSADTAENELITDLELNDLSFLWSGERSQNVRLGFIGKDFQRLQLHFISVIKNFDNPFEYFLYGKTKVSENICAFQGSLVIRETGYIEDENFPDLRRGYIRGDYVLVENPVCLHSGIFRGDFFSSFYIDSEGTFYYDDLEEDAKYFTNNEFWGEWYDYKSDTVLTANWGDYRIPGSEGLDVGEESFQPSFRYLDKGWRSYQEKKEDSDEEHDEWWKGCNCGE